MYFIQFSLATYYYSHILQSCQRHNIKSKLQHTKMWWKKGRDHCGVGCGNIPSGMLCWLHKNNFMLESRSENNLIHCENVLHYRQMVGSEQMWHYVPWNVSKTHRGKLTEYCTCHHSAQKKRMIWARQIYNSKREFLLEAREWPVQVKKSLKKCGKGILASHCELKLTTGAWACVCVFMPEGVT